MDENPFYPLKNQAVYLGWLLATASLLFPVYYRGGHIIGRHFFAIRNGVIDWSDTIQQFLLVYAIGLGVFWTINKIPWRSWFPKVPKTIILSVYFGVGLALAIGIITLLMVLSGDV